MKVSEIPKLMNQWNEKNTADPMTINASSAERLWWKCKECGYEWQASPKSRTMGSGLCPSCKRNVSNVAYIMKYWGDNDIDPKTLSTNSSVRINLKCPDCGHSWNRKVETIYRHHCKCPECKKIDNATRVSDNPYLMRFWNNPDINPDAVSIYSKRKVNWKCPDCGYEWQSQVSSRTTARIKGCPACNHLVATAKHNAITEYPELGKYYDYNAPNNPPLETLLPTSRKKVHWKCPDCDYHWEQPLKERIRRHDGEHRVADCPVCAGTAVKGVNTNIQELYPTIADEWDTEKNGTTCCGVKTDSTANYWWLCELGHSYKKSVKDKITDLDNGQISCPYCDDRRVYPGLNSLKALYPNLMKEWDYVSNYAFIDPDKISPGSKEDAWWICPEGHTYKMRINHRTMFAFRHIQACPYCKGINKKKSHIFRKKDA